MYCQVDSSFHSQLKILLSVDELGIGHPIPSTTMVLRSLLSKVEQSTRRDTCILALILQFCLRDTKQIYFIQCP